MSNAKATTVLLCGVGGQGTILAADLLAHAALAAGTSVKVSEIHGMAQRGGAVTTVVRFGDEVPSMVCDPGTRRLRRVVRDDRGAAQPAVFGRGRLPAGGRRGHKAAARGSPGAPPCPPMRARRWPTLGATLIPARPAGPRGGQRQVGERRAAGRACPRRLPFALEAWERIVADRVPPKTVEANLAAFRAGRAFALPADEKEEVREA